MMVPGYGSIPGPIRAGATLHNRPGVHRVGIMAVPAVPFLEIGEYGQYGQHPRLDIAGWEGSERPTPSLPPRRGRQ